MKLTAFAYVYVSILLVFINHFPPNRPRQKKVLLHRGPSRLKRSQIKNRERGGCVTSVRPLRSSSENHKMARNIVDSTGAPVEGGRDHTFQRHWSPSRCTFAALQRSYLSRCTPAFPRCRTGASSDCRRGSPLKVAITAPERHWAGFVSACAVCLGSRMHRRVHRGE